MTVENDFLPFATAVGANVLDQADYDAAAWVSTGFADGLAVTPYLNKVWRQSSVIATAVAAFVVQQTGEPTLDNGDVVALTALLTQAILQPPYVLVEEQQASGTAGGTFTSGAWQTRALNNKVEDTQGIATLATSEVTLPAGIYQISGRAIGSAVAQHQTRLYNVTGSAVLLNGTSEDCGVATGASTRSFVEGQVTLGVTTTIALQHRCNTTVATTGFGVACGFGEVEVYSRLEIWKIG